MSSRAALLLALAAALWLGGCSTTREPSPSDLGLPGSWDGPGGGSEIERGMASWYGQQFHGRRTASGEVFDASGLTAASRTLPFGTRLRVCRLERCVVVRINDRGPFVGHRVLDLSHGASRVLGFSGVAFVTATPVPERVAPRARRARTAPPVRRAAIPAVLALPAAVPASNLPALAQVAPATETVPPVLGLFGAGFVGTAACGFRGVGRPRLFPCP